MNKKQPSVKILVAYHKPAFLLDSDFIYPIEVGVDAKNISKDGIINKNDSFFDNMLKDNTGDNISCKNRYYSELTALYWAWKNYDKLGNPDYIGLMQYRRHFILKRKNFNLLSIGEKTYSSKGIVYPDKNYLEFCGLTLENIRKILLKYKGVLTLPAKFKYMNIKSAREDYEKNIDGVNVKDFDILIKTVNTLYPEMKPFTNRLLKESTVHLYQMFILPKEIFFKYMEFLFSILFEIENKIDFSNYNINGQRTLGYLGEKLFDIYFTYRMNIKSETYLEAPVTFLQHPIYQKQKKHKFILLYKIFYKLLFGNERRKIKSLYKRYKNENLELKFIGGK